MKIPTNLVSFNLFITIFSIRLLIYFVLHYILPQRIYVSFHLWFYALHVVFYLKICLKFQIDSESIL